MQVPAFLAVLVFSFSPCLLRAQSVNASLTGRVTDPSRGAIVEARVAAINAGTNFQYAASTNSSGEYFLTNLPPGSYRIEVEKSGFKKLIRPDVILHIQDALEINFAMTLGEISEIITVLADLLPVETSSGTVSTVVDHSFVENMPLNGRSFQTLILLTPGVVVTQTAFDDQGQFSVNGQRADANYFTVDGVSANFGVTSYGPLVQSAGGALPALSALGGTNSLVSVEAMQEFRVQTSSFAPEFGRTPGGQISIATRSGTNQFHGTAFEYFRNDVLDANDWFSNANHLPKPAERQNDFGGVFGGPLKDKTFFFFSYEGLRLRQPATQETVVPDLASRQAAPLSMQPYLNAYPVPNGPELGSGTAQFNGSYSNPSSLNAYSIRIDHTINSRVTLFGRYNYSPSHVKQRGETEGYEPNLSVLGKTSASVQTFTTGLSGIISSAISNEFRANYSNDRVGLTFSMDQFGGAAPVPDSALFPSPFTAANSFYGMEIFGVGELIRGVSSTDEQRQVNLLDNLSVTTGSHQIKFGVDYRWLSPFSNSGAYGQFSQFQGVTACTSQPCVEQPTYALSGTVQLSATFANQSNTLLAHNYSFYGQDTWELTPRLTVTYGLRWDINPPLEGKNLANQPFTVTNLNDPANMALAPRGTAMYQTKYGNVAPRVGLAYRLDQSASSQTVLRAGLGVFYDLGYGSMGGVSSYFPYSGENIFFSVPFPLTPADAAPPAISASPPVSNILLAQPNLKLPRTYEWNVALEKSFGSSQAASLTYIGAIGRDLLRATNLVNPNPNFQFANVTSNTATSDYHALQLKLERRLSHGLQALASYTFSHSIDIASTDAAFNYLNTPSTSAYSNVDRGNSDFDIRHSFTAGITYDLPSPKWNTIAHATLGGWSVDTFVLGRTAPPDNIVGAPYFGPGGTALFPRPNVVPGVPQVLYGSQYPGGKIFNVAAFAEAAPGTQGDFGRNVLRGFNAVQADVAFQRQFHLTERLALRFRGEFFNLFNHPNFASPNNNITDPLFGHSTQTLASSLGPGGLNGGFNALYQIGGPRSIQLALKMAF